MPHARPHLYIYSHTNELEEVGVISLRGVKVEQSSEMEPLLGVSHMLYGSSSLLLIYYRNYICSPYLLPQIHTFLLLLTKRSCTFGSPSWTLPVPRSNGQILSF